VLALAKLIERTRRCGNWSRYALARCRARPQTIR
jgi:hypothetical protein